MTCVHHAVMLAVWLLILVQNQAVRGMIIMECKDAPTCQHARGWELCMSACTTAGGTSREIRCGEGRVRLHQLHPQSTT